jgi:tetratricopeptide (TPR) repeat protein
MLDFDKLWNYSEPVATRKAFEELIRSSSAIADESYRLQLLTQIARTYSLQGRFDESHATLDQVQRAMKPQTPAIVRVRFLLERGRAFNSSGRREEARPLFAEAFETAAMQKLDFYAIDAAHMLGIAEIPEKQMGWNERALALAEASDDPRARRWAGALYNNMGWTLFEAGQYEHALDLFRKGVEFRAANNQPRELRIAKHALAKTLRMMGKTDDALAIVQSIYDEAAAANDPSGDFCEELAECLLARDRPEAAKPYFKEAYERLRKDAWVVEHEPHRMARLESLGE